MTFKFVDCQGFGGAMACGAALSGFQLVGKLEKPGGFGVPLVEAQRGRLLGDGWKTQVGEPKTWEPVRTDVVVGTPPCSAFSMMTAGYEAHGVNSRINDCMRDLTDYAVRVRPAAMVMESVTGAYRQGVTLMRELAETLNEGTGLSYRTTHVLQDNYSLGGVTRRKRYFLVLSQVPFGVEPEDLERLPTMGDALGDLEGLNLQWEDQDANPPTWYTSHLTRSDRRVDGHVAPTSAFARRTMDVGTGEKGVDWHEGELLSDVLRRFYETHGHLPESWAYRSMSKKRPDLRHLTRDKQLQETGFQLGGFNQTMRWRWDEPGRVLTGAGPFMVWHRERRFLTHREAARLMGFPDEWRIAPCKDDPRLFLYWGKGTSVHPARWVMGWLRESLEGRPGEYVGRRLEDGSRLVDVSTDWKRVQTKTVRSDVL